MKSRHHFKNVKFILPEVWSLYVLSRVVTVITVIHARAMVWREIRKTTTWFFIIKKLKVVVYNVFQSGKLYIAKVL